MTKVFTFIAIILCCGVSAVHSQTNVDLQRVELLSPWVLISESPHKVQWDKERAKASCLDLRTLAQGHCQMTNSIGYGDRIGDHRDLFAIEIGPDQQTRIVDMGKHDWSDKFDVPYIRPWAKLKPGESRFVAFNASGTTAPDRKTYAKTSLANQVKSGVKKESGNMYEENYTPLMEAIEGHMYAVRVLDSKNDYYILLRADKVVTGTSVAISFKKAPSPQGPIF
jgi:hypothetical protein